MLLSGIVAFGQNIQSASSGVGPVQIVQVEPTPLFPKPQTGKALKQLVRLYLNNSGKEVDAVVKITLGKQKPEIQELSSIVVGKSKVLILVPDITVPTPIVIEILTKGGKQLASQKLELQPQKKWNIFGASYSHQDLGYGDYPHRLRTSIRHENIKLPLKFCSETDDWSDDAKYRFNIETSEPITSFISFNGKEAARELGQRIREGRIELGGLHNTINTEELSHELMARLFYMTGRYAVDLLGAPAGKTIQNTDLIGLAWPLATFAKEAGFEYCFHGYNWFSMPNKEDSKWLTDFSDLDSEKGQPVFAISREPNFYWQGPDGQQLLRRATTYARHSLLGGHGAQNLGPIQDPTTVEMLIRAHEKIKWPFSTFLSQDGNDFTLAQRVLADRTKNWNETYLYPHLRIATFENYFQTIEKEMADKKIRLHTVALDENNQWSDQDYAAARATGQARRLSEELPATETLNTFAQVMAGGNNQWINLFQGYHRLLQYFEHTNAKDSPHGNMCWYETELEENREMITESAGYKDKLFASASQRLSSAITRTAEKNLIVFNSLPYKRTDIVHTFIPSDLLPVDAVTGAKVPVQQLPDGSAVFVATDIPATGYKTYQLTEGKSRDTGHTSDFIPALENKFYRIEFNQTTGALTSLFDKSLGIELIEKNPPYAFNAYLYEFRTSTKGLDFNSVWSRMAKADSISIYRGPVADVLTVIGRAGGVKQLKQTVTLYHDLARVDFGLWMDKLPFGGMFGRQHEAAFIALPFAIPNFTIHHELPGAVIEPYRQQVEGSATDHYAIRSFTDLSNDKYGVTVSPIEGSLVCYGEPTSMPMSGLEYYFKRDRTCPATSRMYLYLLNNMFNVNIAADQQGPVSFHWALRSHAGDWKAGGANRFGRSMQQPLMAWRADGKNSGTVSSGSSFMSVDVPNVMCSVIKPAEANGQGLIVRLNESIGQETTATVSLPMLKIISACATSLVENDRPERYQVNGNSFKVLLPKFGVKTIRIICAGSPLKASGLNAKAVADMQVDLSWQNDDKNVSHFNIYRDTNPDCTPTLLNFIGQSSNNKFIDRPRVNIGGWLRSCLSPKTTYYYRIVPVDRLNNPGPPGGVAMTTTLSSDQVNLPPIAVEGLRPILVSPISKKFNFVNLLFRTSCEPDVMEYEIYRSTVPEFSANANTQIGVVKSDDIPPRSGGYGESHIQYKNRDYDHAFYMDETVEPETIYYYKVCAVDAAGQRSEFSPEVSIRTKQPILGDNVTSIAQSDYAPEYSAENLIDGSSICWISKQYGGGTKEKPLDIWWQAEFSKNPISIKGLKIIGDKRTEVAQIGSCLLQMRIGGVWKEVAGVKGAKGGEIEIVLDKPIISDGIKLIFPAGDLPFHNDAVQNGIVRVNEIRLILPDGKEMFMNELN